MATKDLMGEDVTKFNMSIATLMRINEVLLLINKHWFIKNYPQIRTLLIILYKETYPFLDPDQNKEALTFIKTINKNIAIDKTGYKMVKNKFIPELHDFELWLRERLLEKGLLMATQDETTLALGQV